MPNAMAKVMSFENSYFLNTAWILVGILTLYNYWCHATLCISNILSIKFYSKIFKAIKYVYLKWEIIVPIKFHLSLSVKDFKFPTSVG
jgi:hypothetical protein